MLTSIETSAFIAFFVGFASTLHCLGMCSGIAGGLSASLPLPVRSERSQHISFLLAYNLGRVTSYAIVGGLVGGLSNTAFQFFNPGPVHLFIHISTTLMLALMALYLMGLFPKFSSLQYLGNPVWKYLEPVGRKLLPVKSRLRAFNFGMVWGWLPCGLVYSMLFLALASGSVVTGATILAAFGLGTLPSMLFAGYLSTYLLSLKKLPIIRTTIGGTLLVVAMVYLFQHNHMTMDMLAHSH
ncbi:MAG: sulfite exporter TauE/SafE family protein [Gammaproteobacteria bacterium]|nr:sulfite exporter TauE/SafE family protein [Gammaproteobacteria bacterium]MDH5799505.1 sulfite exporter TauE/SafE family protein [Gammaproteobacteria bacterium]